MSKRRGRTTRGLSSDEDALWKGVIRSVAPLRSRITRRPADEDEPAEPPAPVRRKSAAAAPSVSPAVPKPKAPPAPAALDRKLKQRIARGSQAIEARIDLHGMTQAQAHSALLRFLHRAQAQDTRTVLVITGKGARGEGDTRGVLKRQVPQWLKTAEFRALVIGFDSAAGAHGGEGALYLQVRKGRS